jgi:hypothetical protein
LRARLSLGNGATRSDPQVETDLGAPIDLSRPVSFAGSAHAGTVVAAPFGAPAPCASALRVGHFVGDVAQGGSCNCSVISLTPHASGTHTECVSHLTREALDAWTVVPRGLVPALLLRVSPRSATVTADEVAAAWAVAAPRSAPYPARAALIGCLDDARYRSAFEAGRWDALPFLAPDAVQWLIGQGIEHLLVDLPSLDPVADGGALAAHRDFFGLARGEASIAAARRAQCTVTELARFPSEAVPGAYLLSLQVPAIAGDAVPSRPLLYPVRFR